MQKLKNGWNWLISDKIRLLLIIVVVGMLTSVVNKHFYKVETNSVSVGIPNAVETKIIENMIEQKKKEEVKKVPIASESCTPNEAKIVLSDELIQKKMNLFMMDFNSARVKGYDLTTDYFTKEKIFGVKRELVANDFQVYIMLYENVDKLERNKEEYAKYIKNKPNDFIKVEK